MRPEIEKAVLLMQRGGDEALEEALSLLQKTVFSFSMKVCGQREDAEDTMQEVLIKTVPFLPRFDSPKALVVWLYKVAKSRCLMNRRKSKFASQPDLSLDELMPDRQELESLSACINPETFAIRSEEAGKVRAAIQRLPPQYRIVLVLRDMEGLTDEEVAEITGLRAGTVRVRLHRARLFVRKELANARKSRPVRKVVSAASRPATGALPRPARCREMFAELSNYLDERLDDSMCGELEKHIDGCAPCQAFVSSLESTIVSIRRMPSPDPDPVRSEVLKKGLLSQYKRAIVGGFPNGSAARVKARVN